MGEIVKLQFHDADINERDGILKTYYLIAPDREKLLELRDKVENRFDDPDYDDRDGYWDVIDSFVRDNFSTIEIADTFVIEY
jgi:hypothetical protein